MTKQKTWYDKGSLADVTVQFATSSWKVIRPLTESQQLSEKLLGYNALAFTFVCGIILTHLLIEKETVFSLAGMLFFVISVFISFVVSSIYIRFVRLLTNISKDKVATLRIANVILLAGLPFASAGLAFNISILTSFALGIVVIQLFFMFIGIFVVFSSTITTDIKVNPHNYQNNIGRVELIITLIEFSLTVIMFVSAIINKQLF
jgi:hypothetical protein